MLDLSFLTEEEQEAIMKVLQRDADLKKAEDERVRTLEETIDDTNEFKNKSGQWFYEAKSKRHRDKIHGADLIRASIRKKKPQTLAELSQSRNDKTKKSWVSNVNKDFFIPPELVGVMEEPEKENEEEKTRVQLYRSAPRVDSLALSENDSSVVKAVSSPSKQRKNPFNDPSLENNFELPIENHISQNGAPNVYETPENDMLVPSQKSQDNKTMPTVEFNEVHDISTVAGVEVRNEKPAPKPKARTVTYKISDLQSDSDSSPTKPAKKNDSMNGTGARRGILKRTPSSSSTDSEILRVSMDAPSKPVPPASPILEGEVEKSPFGDQMEDSSQNSLDRLKQVRFTSVEPQTLDAQNGREIGEFDLLESDYAQNSTNGNEGFKHKDNDLQSFQRPVPVHSKIEKLDSDLPVPVSAGETADASLEVTLPSFSSNLDNNLKLSDGPKTELVPNSYATSVQSLPEDSELLQERGTSAEDTKVRRPNGISVNILENGAPTIGNNLNKLSADLSDNELQTSKLMIDQQPIYAKIKSPRVSKLDPVDITQDQQPLHAEIKSPQVSELDSTDHQQGKPARVEDLTPNTSSKPDKYTIEFKKAADESISKVLDWFNRDSGSGGDKAVHMNSAPGKGVVEKSETAVKTNNSALLSEYDLPNADLRHSEIIQESQNTNHYDNSKQPTPNGDSEWRQERLSFGNVKNGGGKSGDIGFHGEVGVKNETLETKAFPQEVEKPFNGNNTEKLTFGMSKSGGGKMNSELEYPTTAIQKVNLLAIESVPLSNNESPVNRNFNFSESYKEKPQIEKHEDEELPNNVQSSEAEVVEKVNPSVLDEKNFQEDPMVYWRRPSILEQNTHMQLPKRLDTVKATDVKPSKEWEKMASNSSIGQSTSEEISSDVTFDAQLVKSPTKTKVTPKDSIEKTTAELPTSNVEAPAKTQDSLKNSVEKTRNELPTSNEEAPVKVKPVYSLEKTKSKLSALNDKFLEFTWESKASASVQIPDKLIGRTNEEPVAIESLSEKWDSELVHYPKPSDLQQKGNIMPMSLSSEKLNVDQAVPEQVMSPDSQNKHNFKVLTFKERLNETPSVPLSNPKQFQSLRTFWGTIDKSLSKPEISLRRARNLHGSKDSGFVKLETNLGHTTPDRSLNRDKWSSSEESPISPREWYKKAAEPAEIVPSRDEVVETVNKVFVPSKSENDAFKSSLDRLGKASTKNSDDAENKLDQTFSLPNLEASTLKTEIQNESLEQKSQPPQESFYDMIKRRSQNLKDHRNVQEIQHPDVRETVEQENAPRNDDSTELKVSPEKVQKEALVVNSPFNRTSEITFPVPRSASTPVLQSSFNQSKDTILPQEIEEIIEKEASPPKADLTESSVGLQKLLKEASVMGPLSSKVTKNEEAVKPEPPSVFENVNYSFPEVQKKIQLDREEVQENVSKMEAPEKLEFSDFNSGLDKLYKEAAEPLPVTMDTIYTKKKIDGSTTNQDAHIFKQGVFKPSPERVDLSYQQRQLPAEVNETVDKTTVLPKVDTCAFDEGLGKLLQEAMDSSNSEQSMENLSRLPDSSAYSSDYKLSVKKQTFSQVDVVKEKEKLATDVDVRKDTPVSETPNTKVIFHQKIVPTNDPPANSELYFDKENRNLEVTYPELDYEHLRNEESDNEDLVAGAGFMSDARSGTFVRASTPVKEGGVSVNHSTLELNLSLPPNENGVSRSLGSGLSDGNADSYTGSWKNSSRSEEDSNLVLSVLRRSANKQVSSKSLEDISSATSTPEKVDVPKEESVRNAENGSTLPAYPENRFQDPEKLKRLSKSVPDFLQDESDDRETDSTSEGSFPLGRHKKTPSSLTNLSGSSGMASLSSVSGSVMSIYSGDFGNLDVKGNIQFAIDYVEQLQEFHIFVAQCKELAVADEKKQRSDPYVKSYLLPGKEKMGKRKTAVRKKTLNPAYNEILRYKINKQVLLTQKLNLSVWHNDTFGRNSFLGEVDIDLATWDWSNKHMNWYALQPRTPAAGIGLENRGEISIALKYTTTLPSGKKTASSGEVHIWVKGCSNLPVLRGNRISSFVKCTVLPDTSRKSRQKTRTVDKTTNPVFNHTMVYDGFRAEDLREACVELTVWDHNRLANHFLGGLRLGLGSGKSYGTPVDWMDSTAYESSLWKRMINMPNEWVEDTLQLRMLMMAKMSK